VQILVLVLQHHGHFLGIFGQHVRGDADSRSPRLERDVEVVGARQAFGHNMVERRPDHAAQRFMRQPLVLHLVDRRGLVGHRHLAIERD